MRPYGIIIVVILLILLAAVFGSQNATQKAKIQFLRWTSEVSVIGIILFSFMFGLLIGCLIFLPPIFRGSRQFKEYQQRIKKLEEEKSLPEKPPAAAPKIVKGPKEEEGEQEI